jgi:hypothetical protein
MATKTISVRNEVEGVLTDLDACTLSDPTGTFGVREVGTGTVIVANGTALSHDGTGLYSYGITGLTTGVTYQAYVARLYLGETSRESVTFTVAAGASDTYSVDADLDNWYGPNNVAAWADLNSNGDADEIAARKAWARGVAYRWINSKLRGADLTAPATSGNFAEFDLLADVEAERAGAILYQSRGVNDRQQASGKTDGVMQAHFDHAEKELDRLIASVQANDGEDSTASAGTFQFVPISRGSAADEYTSN